MTLQEAGWMGGGAIARLRPQRRGSAHREKRGAVDAHFYRRAIVDDVLGVVIGQQRIAEHPAVREKEAVSGHGVDVRRGDGNDEQRDDQFRRGWWTNASSALLRREARVRVQCVSRYVPQV